jgi:thiamine pyrophosphokinase
MMKSSKYIIFLHNKYPAGDNDFYLKRLKGSVTIAADGGVRFFKKNNLKPDVLIGDFDSAPRLSAIYLKNIEVIRFPSRKDKTDSQLALELALKRGAKDIEICGAFSKSEIDHTLANVFLLILASEYRRKNKIQISVKMVTPDTSILLADNETIELKAHRGDFLSIIPLENNCRVEYDNMDYPAPQKSLRMGESLTLRNRFVRSRSTFTAHGRVLVIITAG